MIVHSILNTFRLHVRNRATGWVTEKDELYRVSQEECANLREGIPYVNHLTPNGHYMGRTAQLTSRRYILYIYSTNIRTEYFKHAA